MIGTPYLSAISISLLAPFKAEGRAARVLKVWEDVNEFRSDLKRRFQLIDDHAILIRADGDVLCTIRIPRLQRAEICGRLTTM